MHRTDIVDAAGLLILATAFVVCTYLLGGNALLEGSDFIQIFSFHKSFIRDAILHDRTLPLWSPWSFAGRPFLADPVTQVLYPGTLLWLLLPPGAALTVDAILHFWLGGIGMRALCGALGIGRHAALIAAIAYMLSGYNVARGFIGHLQYYEAAAYLPWVFAFIEHALQTGRVRPLLAAAVGLALQALSGCTPVIWITYLFSGLLMVLHVVALRPSLRDCLAAGACWLLLVAVATGLCAVQLLPTAELAGASARVAGGAEYAAMAAFPVSHLALLLFPSLKLDGFLYRWESFGYVGVLTLLLGVAALGAFRRDARVRTFAMLALAAVPLMLAHETPLFDLLLTALPGYGWLRAHAREFLVWVLALPVLSAIGFERLCERPARWPLTLTLVILTAATAVFYRADDLRWWQFAMIASALGVVWTAGRVAVRWTFVAAALLLAGDLFLTARVYPTLFRMGQRIPALEAGLRQSLEAAPGTHRLFLPAAAARPNIGYALKRATVGGNEGLVPGRYYAFVHALADTPVDPGLPTSLNEEMFVRRPSPFPFKVLDVGWTLVAGEHGNPYRLLADPAPSGRMWLTDRWRVLPSFDAVVSAMKAPSFAPHQEVLFEEQPSELPVAGDGPPGTAALVSSGINDLEVAVQLQRAAFLVLSETYYPGWRAAVDGQSTPILRADGVLRSVYVAPGTHRVHFTFRPWSLIGGAMVSAATLLLVGVGLARGGRLPRWLCGHERSFRDG